MSAYAPPPQVYSNLQNFLKGINCIITIYNSNNRRINKRIIIGMFKYSGSCAAHFERYSNMYIYIYISLD